MKITAHIDTSPFNNYVQELAQRSRVSVAVAVKGEAAAVLKLTAAKFKPASIAKIKWDNIFRRIEENNEKISINKGGRVWGKIGEKWKILGENRALEDGWHLADEDFSLFSQLFKKGEDKAKDKAKSALERRGLAGNTWVRLIEGLGINPISAPPASTRLNRSLFTARAPNLVASQQIGEGTPSFQIAIENYSTVVADQNGLQKLNDSILRRRAAFANNVKHGVFSDARAIAQRYPFMQVENTLPTN